MKKWIVVLAIVGAVAAWQLSKPRRPVAAADPAKDCVDSIGQPACRGNRRGGTSEQTGIELAVNGPPILAVGDAIALVVRRHRCYGDVCELVRVFEGGKVRWVSDSLNVATIDAQGQLRGVSPGHATILAVVDTQTVSVSVRVLPAVRDIVWTVHPKSGRVGDTLRVEVIARDASGHTVATLAPVEHISGTGGAGQVMWIFDQPGPTKVFLDRPGMLVLVGRLADRVDTLRIRVDP